MRPWPCSRPWARRARRRCASRSTGGQTTRRPRSTPPLSGCTRPCSWMRASGPRPRRSASSLTPRARTARARPASLRAQLCSTTPLWTRCGAQGRPSPRATGRTTRYSLPTSTWTRRRPRACPWACARGPSCPAARRPPARAGASTPQPPQPWTPTSPAAWARAWPTSAPRPPRSCRGPRNSPAAARARRPWRACPGRSSCSTRPRPRAVACARPRTRGAWTPPPPTLRRRSTRASRSCRATRPRCASPTSRARPSHSSSRSPPSSAAPPPSSAGT
mmetsp:Transcript_17544/g.54607  ORF Transcript_17544/g.54607 Transcript_17544/m.54607 type:complete len:276 (+) Transcript_17544:356-1183(+)